MLSQDNAITCRMTMSKWRPSQVVPTYFVSPKPRKGCFTQINDAIQYAQPYSRIELLSGVYTEGILINKAIELGSEKGDEQAVVTYHMTTMVIQSAEAYMEGLTIRNSESQCAVRIDRGSCHIARCEVAGIEVCNDATPVIEECKIENSAVHGISVLQVAGGMYKGNSIINSGWFGINVESTGPVTFMHNSVTEGCQGQIVVRGNGDVNPVFQYNRIIDQIRTQTDPNLIHQTQAYKLEHLPIRTTGQSVVLLPVEMTTSIRASLSEDAVDDAVVTSTDNRCAVDIYGGAHPSFTRNTIVGSVNNGFYIHGGARGNYEHNYVTSNRGWGFVLDGETTSPHIVANSLTGNGGGVKAVSSPAKIDGKNDFVENHGPQVMIVGGHEFFLFANNDLRSGTKVGILCKDGGSGTIEHNSFEQCGTAMRIEHGANPRVSNNVFAMCNIGLYALRGGRGMFHENEFGNLTSICVLLSSAANPIFVSCRFLTSHGGVLATKGARGAFHQCIVKDNKGAQVEISDRANPSFFDCFIADGRDDGVKIQNRGLGTFRRNLIAGNERSQICIRTKADPIIEENVITRSHTDGILVEDGGVGLILNNVVERCRLNGINVVARGRPTVRGNIITLCREAGLCLGEGSGEGVYEKNEIFYNQKANVHIIGAGVLEKDSIVAPTYIRANRIFNAIGVGLLCTSRCEAVVSDNLFLANEGCSIRVSHGSDVTILRNEFTAGKDGVVAVEDSKVRVLANTFSEVKGSACIADEGGKIMIAWNTFEHCDTGITLKNSSGMVFFNALVQSPSIGILMMPLCRCNVRDNMLFENQVAVKIEGRARGQLVNNVMFESEASGLLCDGGDEVQTTVECNTILNCKECAVSVKRGTPKLSLNLLMNCAVGLQVSGEKAAPHLSLNYISCCNRGIHLANKCSGKLEQCVIGQCDVGIMFEGAESVIVKGSLVHNCSAVGVCFSEKSLGEVMECAIFKNFINVLCTSEAKSAITGSLLQAAVCFSVVCTLNSTPLVSRCIIASRALSVDEEGDEAKEIAKQVKIIRANIVKRFGEAAVKNQLPNHFFFIQSLWDDLYSTNPTTVGGIPTEWMPEDEREDATSNSNQGGIVAGSNQDMGDASGYNSSNAIRSRSSSVYSRESRPSSATSYSSAHSATSSSASGLTSAISEGADKNFGEIASPQGVLVTAADILLSKAIPFPRRTSILYPSNLHDCPDDFIGPGGPFVLHRMLGGEGSAFLKGLLTYYSSGIRVDEGANPTIEGCMIRDHGFKLAKIMSKRTPLAPTQLNPSLTEKVSDFAKKVRSRMNSVKGPTLPANGRKSFSRKHNPSNVKRREVVEIQQDEEPTGEGTASNDAVVDLIGAPFVVNRSRLVDRLLLAASPAFYLHPAAPPPRFVMPELFSVDDEAQSKVTEEGQAILKNESAAAFLGAVLTSEISGVQDRQFISTERTQQITGFGAIFAQGAKGTVTRCHFLRNHIGVKIETQATPTISVSTFMHQFVDGVLVKDGGNGVLRANMLSKNKQTQITVQDRTSNPLIQDNEISDTASAIGVLVRRAAQPSIISNRFTKLTTSGAIVVEDSGEPLIQSNRITECLYGLWFRNGGVGKAQSNYVCNSIKFGVFVEGENSCPVIHQNTITDAKESGLHVAGEGAKPTVSENTIAQCLVHGMELIGSSSGTYTANKIMKNTEHGILIRGNSSGLFEANIVESNGGHGARVEDGGTPFIQRNVFQKGSQYGISIAEATGTISQNRIVSNIVGGIHATGAGCTAVIEQNELDLNEIGILVDSGCRAEFNDNVLTRNRTGGILAQGKFTQPLFRGTYFKLNQNYAVRFELNASGTLEESFVLLSQGNGVEILSGANPVISTTVIAFHSENGVYVGPSGAGTVSDSIIFHCEKDGCKTEDSSNQFRLKNSWILDCDCGFEAFRNASGTLINNFFIGKFRQSSATLWETTNVVLDSNLFVDQRIGVSNYGSSRFIDCLFNSCITGLIESSGTSSINGCEFRECQTGLMWAKGSTKVTACSFINNRSGLVVSSDCAPVIEKSSFQRCRVACALDSGSGSLDGCEIFNCADGILSSGDAEIKNCVVYDCTNAGITIRDGKPTVIGNTIYDNYNAGLILDKGAGLVEDNKLYFARDEGALVVRPTSTTVQNRNTIKNSFSPPKEKNVAERQMAYKRQEQEKEKSSVNFKKYARGMDNVFNTVVKLLGSHLPQIIAIRDDVDWLLDESSTDKPQPKQESAPLSAAPSPRLSADPFADARQQQQQQEITSPLDPSRQALSFVEVPFLVQMKDRVSFILDAVKPPKAAEAPATSTSTVQPMKPKQSRASMSQRRQSKKSIQQD